MCELAMFGFDPVEFIIAKRQCIEFADLELQEFELRWIAAAGGPQAIECASGFCAGLRRCDHGLARRFAATVIVERIALHVDEQQWLALRLAEPFDQHFAKLAQLASIDRARSEERRVGKECVSTCRSRWSPSH